MEYIFCPECGAKNEAGTKFCTECGKPFPKTSEPQASPNADAAPRDVPPVSGTPSATPGSAAEVGKPKKKKKAGLFIVLAALVLLLALAAFLFFSGNFDRMMATSRAGAGDYAGALASYEKYLSRSGSKTTDSLTKASLYALSAGDPDKALMYARSIPDDSEEADRLAGMAAAVLAKRAMEKNNWEDALEYLRGIGTEEAKELADECNFRLAEKALDQGDYEKALGLLEGNAYPAAADLLAETHYHYGVSLMEEEKWEEAIAQFDRTAYADSDDLRGQCYFYVSEDYAFLKKLEEANRILMDAENAGDGVGEALAVLRSCDWNSFYDSELAFFAEEYVRALEEELSVRNEYNDSDSMASYEYQEKLFASYAAQSECLETIQEMYPFDDDVWADLYDYNEPSEKWNRIVSSIPVLRDAISSIERSTNISDTEEYIMVPNDTGNALTVTFYFSFYDANNSYIDTFTAEKVLLPAQKETKVVFTYPANANTWDCDFWVDSAEP